MLTAFHSPSKSESRRPVVQILVGQVARNTVLARKQLFTRVEIKSSKAIVQINRLAEKLPSDSQVEGQIGRNAPVVLKVTPAFS